MPNIHALPPPTTLEGISRTISTLKQAFAEGQDLGPRAPHIRALGVSLGQNLVRLRTALAAMPIDPDMHLRLEETLTALSAVADQACDYKKFTGPIEDSHDRSD